MQLSANFYLREFLRSQTAARIGRVIEPTEKHIDNLRWLCVSVLQPLRDEIGPIVITSGLRPQWLNTLIGGSPTSAHMEGRAADIEAPGMRPIDVCRTVERLKLPIDQCIHEFGEWTHLGISAEPRNQYLTARHLHGRTVYEIGINA